MISKYILLSGLLLSAYSCKKATETVKSECSINNSTNAIHYGESWKFNIECTNRDNIKKIRFYLDGNLINVTSNLIETYSLKFDDNKSGFRVFSVESESLDGTISAKNNAGFEIYLKEGDKFQNGIVFYTNSSRTSGLIAATTDLIKSPNIEFEYGDNVLIGANSDNDGYANTEKMKANSSDAIFAATALRNGYEIGGFGNWFIPSKDQLALLKEKKDLVGGFSPNSSYSRYWSSTELNASTAFALNFNALMGTDVPKSSSYKVRLIKSY